MAVKFADALGAHVVVFTTSPKKKEDALRLGADEVVVSRNADEMKNKKVSLVLGAGVFVRMVMPGVMKRSQLSEISSPFADDDIIQVSQCTQR
jgi:D-arabinose 1-dehydrogenase-like Zn-dependent alcohol dehydrogenase